MTTHAPTDRLGLERAISPEELAKLVKKYGKKENIPAALLIGAGMTPKDARKLVKILLKPQQEIDDFFKTTKPALQDGMTIGFNLGRQQNAGPAVTVDQLFEIKAANKALESISLKAAKKALGTTTKDLEKLIMKNFKTGGGANDLAALISSEFEEDYLGRRSLLVARTEATGVLNEGTLQQMKEDDVESKWWRATLDGRQRPTHEAVMQETMNDPIPVNEEFEVGDSSGMCPGDQRLSIEERANCRCALVSGKFAAVRCRYYDLVFLRNHGSYERKLQQSVNVYFRRMTNRVLTRLKTADYPY